MALKRTSSQSIGSEPKSFVLKRRPPRAAGNEAIDGRARDTPTSEPSPDANLTSLLTLFSAEALTSSTPRMTHHWDSPVAATNRIGGGPLDSLPDEIVGLIMTFLPRADVISFGRTCKRFLNLINHVTFPGLVIDVEDLSLSSSAILSALQHGPRAASFINCTYDSPLNTSEIALPLSWRSEGQWSLLQSVSFRQTNVDDRLLISIFERTPRLRSLDLSCTTAGDDVLRTIAQHCPDLRQLMLNMNTTFSEAGLGAILHTAALTHLSLAWVQHTPAMLQAVTAAAHRTLTHLDLAGWSTMTSEMLVALVEQHQGLTVLDLSDCVLLNDAVLPPLGNLPLTGLALSRCSHFTPGAIMLLSLLPSLLVFTVFGSNAALHHLVEVSLGVPLNVSPLSLVAFNPSL